LELINPRREKVAGNLRSGMYARRFQCLCLWRNPLWPVSGNVTWRCSVFLWLRNAADVSSCVTLCLVASCNFHLFKRKRQSATKPPNSGRGGPNILLAHSGITDRSFRGASSYSTRHCGSLHFMEEIKKFRTVFWSQNIKRRQA